ncbi:MAG: hypothetical protein DYG92_14750 [Leptolyngbya sp. PLA1]|nr:hypothetical protein [Leptolyngbya sp. PLA1]
MNRFVLFGVGSLALAASAHAEVWLTGVVNYSTFFGGSSSSEPLEYDNILGTGNSPITINGAPRGTTFPLSVGTNDFTTSLQQGFNGFSLYFSTNEGPFDRPFNTLPDLVTYGYSNQPLPLDPGAMVQTNGQFSGLLPYSGATSVIIGDYSVSVTGLGIGVNGNSNTFQITVTPVPAPSAAAALCLAGVAAIRRRRTTHA